MTTSTNAAENETYAPTPKPKTSIDFSRLPLKGDIMEISYSGGSKNDPVRVIRTNYFGDTMIRYTDSQGAEDKISLFDRRNTEISWQVTNSVFDDNDDVKSPYNIFFIFVVTECKDNILIFFLYKYSSFQRLVLVIR